MDALDLAIRVFGLIVSATAFWALFRLERRVTREHQRGLVSLDVPPPKGSPYSDEPPRNFNG